MASATKGPSQERSKSKVKTVKDAGKEEWTLGYFHGALMDQDVELLLKAKGDFLLQLKSPGPEEKTILVVRESRKGQARRFEISHEPTADSAAAVKLASKSFSSIGALVKHYKKSALPEGGDLVLAKAIPRDKFNIWHSDVKIGNKIGSGAYGTVFKGTVKSCGNQVIAIKQIDSDGTDEEALKEMMKEARVMQLYDHRNIVRFYGFVVDRLPYLLVMEFCDGGAVEDKLRAKGKALSIITRADWCAQAAAGMEYLHSKECIHRDIAARNCLLDRSVLKMADFGMCRPTAVYKVDVSKPMNVRWLAPEVWTSAETRYNTDVFAFGVLLWEMFEIPYHTPYDGLRALEVKTKTQEGYRMSPPEAMPEAMAEVMEKAWHQDPAKRPDAKKLRRLVDGAYKKIEAGGGGGGKKAPAQSKSNVGASDEKP